MAFFFDFDVETSLSDFVAGDVTRENAHVSAGEVSAPRVSRIVATNGPQGNVSQEDQAGASSIQRAIGRLPAT